MIITLHNNSSFHICTFIFFILVISLRLSCSSQVDEVTRLPNQPKVGFKQYAGYVFLDHDRALFYYFVQAQIDSASKPRVLWLNGRTRSLINELAKDLGLNITEEYRAWFRSKQVAGWTEVYGDILTFATIRGAGHAAPFYQPGRSLLLFKAFLDGNPLPNRH